MKLIDYNDITKDTPFITHGYYTLSNTFGYEVEITEAGEYARLKDPNGKITDWLEVGYVDDNEGEEDTDSSAVIDVDGYHIPFTHVMRVSNYS